MASHRGRYAPLTVRNIDEAPPEEEDGPDACDEFECPSTFVPSPIAIGLRRPHIGGLCVLLGVAFVAAWVCGGPSLSVVRSAAQRTSELVLVIPKRSGRGEGDSSAAPSGVTSAAISAQLEESAHGAGAGAGSRAGTTGAAADADTAGSGAAFSGATDSPTSTRAASSSTTSSTQTSSTSTTVALAVASSSTTTTVAPTSSTTQPLPTTTAAPSTSSTSHPLPTTTANSRALPATTSTTATTTDTLSGTTPATVAGQTCQDVRPGDPCHRQVAWAMQEGIRAHPHWYEGLSESSSFSKFQAMEHRWDSTLCPRPCAEAGPASRHGAPAPAPAGAAPAACHDARRHEPCHADVAWAMRAGIWEHPDWYKGLKPESRFEEFQAELHRQNASRCPRPCRDAGAARHYPGLPGASLDLSADTPWVSRKEFSFYMYRAQSTADFPLENVDAANLAGVMWYLHNEIVPSVAPHRKYNITRILRFRITMKTTWEFYNVHRRQFGGFVAFDSGRCTVPDCDRIWKHFGFIVGCQFQNTKIAGYLSSVRTHLDSACKEPSCHSPVWYSLPGPCPSMEYDAKTAECRHQMPGGRCQRATGERDCTYSVEEAGEISLDELAGIRDYSAFFHAGNREYMHDIDGGVGNTFWNGKLDLNLCRKRMERVKKLFKQRYPHLPGCDDLPEPPCDFDTYYKDEFTWLAYGKPIAGQTD